MTARHRRVPARLPDRAQLIQLVRAAAAAVDIRLPSVRAQLAVTTTAQTTPRVNEGARHPTRCLRGGTCSRKGQ